MASIIDAFKSNSSFSFDLSSSTPISSLYNAQNALNKEGNPFSSHASNAYWQISFSQPVKIGSYIISLPSSSSWSNTPTSWEISYLLDDSSFISKQIDKIGDLRENTKKF